jgi:hypothetical protein
MATKEKPPKPSAQFKRLLHRYAQCYWADGEKGGKMPEEWPEIEQDLAAAQDKLFAYVAAVEAAAKQAQK